MLGFLLACGLSCTGFGFTLYLGDNALSWPSGALTLEQCEEMKAEIEPQTEAFADLRCEEEAYSRLES
jgi:hypothetical protein